MMTWPPKDPEEVLDYEFDWATKRLENGELITESTWRVESGSVVIEDLPAPSVIAGVTKVWISGGVLGETCIVTNHVKTDALREREWSAKVKIKAK